MRAAGGLQAPPGAERRLPRGGAARRQARPVSHERRSHQAVARLDPAISADVATPIVARQGARGGEMIEQLSLEQLTLTVTEEVLVRAPLERTFDALLEQIGPYNETPT